MGKLNLSTEAQELIAERIYGPACAKCGRTFTSPAQYRKRGADGKPICRDIRGCRQREGERGA